MSVDYDAEFGIGYEVKASENIEGIEEMEDGLEEYLYLRLDANKYRMFQVGEGSCTGDENDFYVCVKKPFKDGFDVTKHKAELEKHLSEIGVDYIGDFDLVGGLHVW